MTTRQEHFLFKPITDGGRRSKFVSAVPLRMEGSVEPEHSRKARPIEGRYLFFPVERS